MARYEERLTAYQSVDFDDLIGLPLKLLRDHAEVREKWQKHPGPRAGRRIPGHQRHPVRGAQAAGGRARPLHRGGRRRPVDLRLARRHAGQPASSCRWTSRNLKVVKLEQNYRSTSAILRAANNVIRPNPKLFPKTLFSELGEGEPVRVVDCDNEEHEAERVVARIQSIRANGMGKDWKDFAVLYRANHQARVFEQALRKAQIPYKVSGGQSFFDRAEIKDLCAWLRLWVNNDDDPAFLRAVTTPKRGIGHQTLQSLGTFASQYKLSLFEALFSSSLGSVLQRARAGQPARVRPLRERPGVPRPPHQRRRGRARLPARLAQGHRLREAPVRRRGQREGRRRALDQRAGVLRLDGAALRRRRSTTPPACRSRARGRACSKWRRPSRCCPPSASARRTRTWSRCRRCTRPRAWSGRT